MQDIIIYLGLMVLGASFGSFAVAQVWRIRARQLRDDKKHKQKISEKEYERLKPLLKKGNKDRSICLSCHSKLQWFDMIPVFSWLFLMGKCRKCKRPIPLTEFIAEVIGAFAFVGVYVSTIGGNGMAPLLVTQFIIWLIATVLLIILFVYDLKWKLLPNSINYTLIAVGAMWAVISLVMATDKWLFVQNIFFAVLILSGLYWAIYMISRGKWIGFGDVKLGLGLALLLADWQMAFIALFSANLIGCLVVIPMMVTKKVTRKTRVPFGPLMISGAFFALFFGYEIINFYTKLMYL